MAQQVKVLAAKTEILSMITRTHVVEQENWIQKVVLEPPPVVQHTQFIYLFIYLFIKSNFRKVCRHLGKASRTFSEVLVYSRMWRLTMRPFPAHESPGLGARHWKHPSENGEVALLSSNRKKAEAKRWWYTPVWQMSHDAPCSVWSALSVHQGKEWVLGLSSPAGDWSMLGSYR